MSFDIPCNRYGGRQATQLCVPFFSMFVFVTFFKGIKSMLWWLIPTTLSGSKHQWIYLHKRIQTCISPCSAFMDPFAADYVPYGGINMTLYNSHRELLCKCRQCGDPREKIYVINTYIKNAVALYGCWVNLCNSIGYSDTTHGRKKSFF